MSDDILYVVEHIEAELQRLGRLVATLRRRVEAQQAQHAQQAVHGDATSTVTTSTISGPAPHPTPMPASAMRTITRNASSRRTPAAIEESDEEAMVRTTGSGSSYGYVRDRRRDDDTSEPRGLHDDAALDRRTR